MDGLRMEGKAGIELGNLPLCCGCASKDTSHPYTGPHPHRWGPFWLDAGQGLRGCDQRLSPECSYLRPAPHTQSFSLHRPCPAGMPLIRSDDSEAPARCEAGSNRLAGKRE